MPKTWTCPRCLNVCGYDEGDFCVKCGAMPSAHSRTPDDAKILRIVDDDPNYHPNDTDLMARRRRLEKAVGRASAVSGDETCRVVLEFKTVADANDCVSAAVRSILTERLFRKEAGDHIEDVVTEDAVQEYDRVKVGEYTDVIGSVGEMLDRKAGLNE